MFDEFIYKKRWLIGGILIFVIICGVSLIIWDRSRGTKSTTENQEIAELKTQNDLLRQQLSNQSAGVAGAATTDEETDKINLNTASAEELDALPNIGPARAADVVAYREENGGFKTIEEIKNIKGIGDKYFEDMKDLITVGGAVK